MSDGTRPIRNALLAGLLLCALVIALQVSFLLAQAGRALGAFEGRAIGAVINMNDTLTVLHGAAVEQRRYYKALTKMAVIDAHRLGDLIAATDARLERATRQIEATGAELRRAAHEGGQALHYTGMQVDAAGYEMQQTLAAGRGTLLNLEKLAGDPALARSAANMDRASAGLAKTTEATAEAAGHLRDMLSPKKRSFWKSLLSLLPRPTLPIR